MGTPSKNMRIQIATVNLFRCGRSVSGQLSTTPVINDSTIQNSLSIPKIYTKKTKKNKKKEY